MCSKASRPSGALKSPEGVDKTATVDYFVDAGDPRVKPLPELTTDQH